MTGPTRQVRSLFGAVKSRGPLEGLRQAWDYIRWRLRGSPALAPSLTEWLEVFSVLRPDFSDPRRLGVVVQVGPDWTSDDLDRFLASLREQHHDQWELVFVVEPGADTGMAQRCRDLGGSGLEIHTVVADEDPFPGLDDATALLSVDFIVIVREPGRLLPNALGWFSMAASQGADIVYADEAAKDDEGALHSPLLKPAWSPRLLLSNDYPGGLVGFRIAAIREVGGFRPSFRSAQTFDALLRISEHTPVVAHIPNILFMARRAFSPMLDPGRAANRETEEMEAIGAALTRRNWPARVTVGRGKPFFYSTLWEPPADTTITIVMPTRDRPDLLVPAVNSVLDRTDDVNFHLVLVDNGSRDVDALRFLEAMEKRSDTTLIRVDDAFNYSRLCNTAVRLGPESDLLLFLNNDTEVIHRNWLRQLAGWFVDPKVVATGPELLYPNTRIQHAGVVIEPLWVARHLSAELENQPRVGDLHDSHREISALTGACLLVRRSAFDKVGGFYEGMPIDMQDIDLCLRLRAEIPDSVLVYDPTYPLIHHELATRGRAQAGNGYTTSRMRMRWGPVLERDDPYYNPHAQPPYFDTLRPLPEASQRLGRVSPRVVDAEYFRGIPNVGEAFGGATPGP